MRKRHLAFGLAICYSAGVLLSPTASAQTGKDTKNKAAKGAKATTAAVATPALAAPIINLGKASVSAAEFAYVYKKNNEKAPDAYTEKSVREYLDLYAKFKLKVMDARRMGEDTAKSYLSEVEGYRKQLVAPYMTEKSVTEKLIREAYDRMGQEVNASHILISCDENADRQDTLKAYNKAMDLRKRILAGESFEDLARKNSDDPSAKGPQGNAGKLGYFTSLQMVYPFEDAAYKLGIGKVSMPVRTRFGYHLIKVNDRRASRGRLKAAHIMIQAREGMTAADSVEAQRKIDEIYARLQKGEDWKTLCAQFSDDGNSKDKGGELPEFGTGQLIPEFEDIAFALRNPGDYSKPFKTAFGLHIVKLIEKVKLKPYEEMEPELKQRVSRDSRSELNQTYFLARLRRDNQLREFPMVLKPLLNKVDTSLLKGKWDYDTKDKATLAKVLFTIKGQPYTVANFYEHVKTTQSAKQSKDASYVLEQYYKAFVNKSLTDYEEAHLEEKYEDYRMLLQEYREGILLFSLMEKKVWGKAMEDTAGLRAYFNANAAKYQWGQRVKATVYSCENDKLRDEVTTKLAGKFFTVPDPKFDAISYDKGSATPKKEELYRLNTLENVLERDTSLRLHIVGLADGKENSKLRKRRAETLRDSLIRRGVPARQLVVVEGPAAAKDSKPEDNMKVTFRVYGSTPRQLERAINAASGPLALKVTDNMFSRGDNGEVDKTNWTVGDHRVEDKGRPALVRIARVEAPRGKTLDEARGLALSDYQNQLEKEWIDSLMKANPVSYNEAEVAKLIKK